ncbi:MAG TPA: chromate transporter [Candidatus Omnitrophica bacterium]|nr:chromate transporter [Candidatus Omnitrophota bacterium]
MILLKLFITFLKVGLFTVGSGYSMLVLAQRYVVDTYHWLTPQEFTDLVAVSEITPGPIMTNLATFVGTRVAGFAGAVFAVVGVIAVPFFVLYAIGLNYTQFKNYPVVEGLLKVVRPMAIGFIAVAIIRLFKTSITDTKSALIAVVVILVTYVFKVNPIYTVLGGLAFALVVK